VKHDTIHNTLPVPILMYHSISTSATPAFYRFTLRPELFAAHMAHLALQGYRTLTMSELGDSRHGVAAQFPPKSVVLTFDDGFADFFTEVLPVLRSHGFVATLYVTTRYVGATSRWLAPEGEADRPILTWAQLQEIAESGVECAAHSDTHPPLDEVPRRRVRLELSRSKRLLEDHLQRTVRSFAYPFGFYSRSAREVAEDIGYSSACTVKELVSTGRDPFMVPRLTVNAGTDVTGLTRLLGKGEPSAAGRCAVEAKRLIWQGLRRHGPDRITSRITTRMARSAPGTAEERSRS
jgi:peptidoglycan/xylan/chitin deacetylase (PgdA/CDA1 family)